jgi:methionyl-tRNA formyltransferase
METVGEYRMLEFEEWSNSPRIVMITGGDLEHRYVANRILEEFDIVAIIVDSGRRQSRTERIRYLTRKYKARQMFSRLMLRLTSVALRDRAHRREQLTAVLGNSSHEFIRSDLVSEVAGINTDAGRAVVRETSPDLLLIYGTGIVGDRVLGMARIGALNLHTGMSPEYRGVDCVFWPVYNNDVDLVGATIHQCTSAVDGGEIYERSAAQIESDDGQFAVFGRCVEKGAELYVDAIRRALTNSLVGYQQDPAVGREYQATDMRLRYDLYVRWLFWRGKVSARPSMSQSHRWAE